VADLGRPLSRHDGRITSVNRRRGLLLVVLVYVAFDFSLADMPGAFMFDADASIESVEVVRGRAPAEVIVLAAPLGGSSPPRAAAA
jgi:hypothetical protein